MRRIFALILPAAFLLATSPAGAEMLNDNELRLASYKIEMVGDLVSRCTSWFRYLYTRGDALSPACESAQAAVDANTALIKQAIETINAHAKAGTHVDYAMYASAARVRNAWQAIEEQNAVLAVLFGGAAAGE